MEFLDERVQILWKEFWPQTGNPPNWDAVGQLEIGDKREWLLVEAKSHIDELRSHCFASPTSKSKIIKAMEKAKRSYHADTIPVEKWLDPCYQFCNRLTMLHFLNKECKPAETANLVQIYFYGDQVPDKECPQSPEEWETVLEKLYQLIGIDHESDLIKKVHIIFIPVNPNATINPSTNISETEDIRNSINEILSTTKGEKFFEPDFGCVIHDMIFDTINQDTLESMSQSVRESLEQWEPRIQILDVNVSYDDGNFHRLLINVSYQIKTTNTSWHLVMPYYLSEGR